jgi:glycosyl transferase family 25
MLKPFESTVFASGSKIGALMNSSPLLKPQLAARRRILTERKAANTTFVGGISPTRTAGRLRA